MSAAIPFAILAGCGVALLWFVRGPRVYRMGSSQVQIRQDKKRFAKYSKLRRNHERNNAPTVRVERHF